MICIIIKIWKYIKIIRNIYFAEGSESCQKFEDTVQNVISKVLRQEITKYSNKIQKERDSFQQSRVSAIGRIFHNFHFNIK